MSEGSNLPREPIRNRSWVHSEPANRTLRRLREDPDYFCQISNAARRDLRANVRRTLTYSDESGSAAEPPAHVINEREFTFGEIDESLIPAVPPNETNDDHRVRRRRRLPSDSTVSNLSQRGDFSLTSYDSSVFDPAEIDPDTRMADETNAAPRNVTSDDVERDISQLRDTLAGIPGALDNSLPGPSRPRPDPERYLRESNAFLAHLDSLRGSILHNQTHYIDPTRADPRTHTGALAPAQPARTHRDDADLDLHDTLAGMPDSLDNPRPGTSRERERELIDRIQDLSAQVAALQAQRHVHPYRHEPFRPRRVTYEDIEREPEYVLQNPNAAHRENLYAANEITLTEESRRRIREARDLVPAFDGSSEEKLKEFLRACKYAYKIIIPAEEYALTEAIMCTKIRGQALTELENREITTFGQLCDSLETCYSRKKSITRLQREFNYLRQKPGEDARTYGLRVEKLASELFEASTDNAAYSPAEKRGIFINIKTQALINYQLGLSERLQTIVRSRAPATLADAISGAVEEERIQGYRGPNTREPVRPYQGQATRPSRPSPPITCAKCGKIGHRGQDCRTSRYANKFTLPRPERPSTINTTDKYCNYCKRNGHTRDECRTLKRDNAEQNKPANARNNNNNNTTYRNNNSYDNYNNDNDQNRNTATNDRRANFRRNPPANKRSEPETSAKFTRDARDYQVNQLQRAPRARTGLNLVILPLKETQAEKIPLLLDTGSAISLIKVRLLKGYTQIYEDEVTLTGITGHHVSTIGRFQATINLRGRKLNHEFYAVRDDFPIEYDGILGIDFMQSHAASCNFEDGKMYLYGKTLNLIPYTTYQVPARSEMIIKAATHLNTIGIVNAEEKRPGVFIGNCLVQPDNYTCAVSIINTTERPVAIATPYVAVEAVPRTDTCETFLSEIETRKGPSESRLQLLKKQLKLQHLNKEEQNAIFSICEEFSELFFLEGDQLTYTTAVEHRIVTQHDASPVNVRPYRLPEKHKPEINRQISDMLTNDIIRPSTSQWNAPLLVVPKKSDENGKIKWRVVIDFRKLNNLTIGDSFPLPNITDILDQLGSAKYFSTLDLASGYHQIPMAEHDKAKTAFSTATGHYEFQRMPFGLKNAPATFQRLMNAVLTGLQGMKCLVYLDDVVVYGSSLDEHNRRLRTVLQRLRQHQLKLQPEKCAFLRKEVVFLGHVISDKGISPDPTKLSAVRNFPTPKNVKDVQAFIGLAGYYRRFINEFSKTAKPLTLLTRKNQPFYWTDAQQDAFDTLKEKLTTAPVLQYPDFTREFLLTTDASDYAIGAILSQGDVGQDRPVAYASRILSRAEQNYSTTEKELLAIVWAAKHFRPYIYGTKFKIITDHKPLVWLFNVTDPGSRLIRWRLKLEEYDYEIIHKSGKSNTNADALSRHVNLQIHTADIPEEDNLQENELPRTYTEEEKKQILYEYHDTPIGGHQGIERTVNRIRLTHEWPGITTDIKNYIARCENCQKNKLKGRKTVPLVITDTPDYPFEKCALDIVGPLTETEQGHRYLLTFQDNLTKFSKAIPIENQEASTIAREFVTKIVLEHGIPSKILTDQGTNFLSTLFKNVCRLLKIEKIQTTAYHPQSNGALERSHRTLAEYLRHYINPEQTDWDEWIPYAMFAYNTTPHTSTGYTPFELVYGHKATLPSALTQPPKPTYSTDDYVLELKERLRSTNQIAKENIKTEKAKNKQYYDRKTNDTTYHVGDKVLLYDETVRRGRSKKLDALWTGPYEVLETHNNANYTIKRGRTTLRTHANRLKLFINN